MVIFHSYVKLPEGNVSIRIFPGELSVFEALQILSDLGDRRGLQAAERCRGQGAPDWLQLVALIHDLGKVMALPQLAGKDQWDIGYTLW
jgi:hypothetical protein